MLSSIYHGMKVWLCGCPSQETLTNLHRLAKIRSKLQVHHSSSQVAIPASLFFYPTLPKPLTSAEFTPLIWFTSRASKSLSVLFDQLGISFCSDGNYDEHLKKLFQMFSVTVKPPAVPVALNFSISSPILVTVFFICYPSKCDVLSPPFFFPIFSFLMTWPFIYFLWRNVY